MVGQHAAPDCVHTPWRRGPPQSPVDPGLTCAHGLGQGGAPAGPPARGRQRSLPIVCAWCHQLIRWKRCEQAGWGQVSHSMCFDCFAFVFPELGPRPARPPWSLQRVSPPAPPGPQGALEVGKLEVCGSLAAVISWLPSHAWCWLTQQICWVPRTDRRNLSNINARKVDIRGLIRSGRRTEGMTQRQGEA
jgi:hypothetical protein